MRGFVAAIFALGLLSACSSSADELERQYDVMKGAGASGEELCAQSKKIAQALLEAGKDDEYRRRKLDSDIECLAVETKRNL